MANEKDFKQRQVEVNQVMDSINVLVIIYCMKITFYCRLVKCRSQIHINQYNLNREKVAKAELLIHINQWKSQRKRLLLRMTR